MKKYNYVWSKIRLSREHIFFQTAMLNKLEKSWRYALYKMFIYYE